MYGQQKRRGRRNSAFFMDVVHIIIGVLITLLAVIIFLNPEGNQILLPFVFLLAAILNVVNCIHKYLLSGRSVGRKMVALAQFLAAALLIGIAVISGISIWG